MKFIRIIGMYVSLPCSLLFGGQLESNGWMYLYEFRIPETRSAHVFGRLIFMTHDMPPYLKHLITPLGEFKYVDKLPSGAVDQGSWVPCVKDGERELLGLYVSAFSNLLPKSQISYSSIAVDSIQSLSDAEINAGCRTDRIKEKPVNLPGAWALSLPLFIWFDPSIVVLSTNANACQQKLMGIESGDSGSFDIRADNSPASILGLQSHKYFESVMVSKTNLQIRFKPSGQLFMYRVGDGSLKKSDYGEVVNIRNGETLFVVGRHDNFVFKPMSELTKDYGFIARSEIDTRSLGGGVNTTSAFVVTSDIVGVESLDGGNVVIIEASEAVVSDFINNTKSNDQDK